MGHGSYAWIFYFFRNDAAPRTLARTYSTRTTAALMTFVRRERNLGGMLARRKHSTSRLRARAWLACPRTPTTEKIIADPGRNKAETRWDNVRAGGGRGEGESQQHSQRQRRQAHNQPQTDHNNLTMSAIVARLTNPATYSTIWANTARRAQAYYHPDVKDNGAKLLWHSMLGVSVIMCSSTYLSRTRPEVEHNREIERIALAEYYQKHGGSPHH